MIFQNTNTHKHALIHSPITHSVGKFIDANPMAIRANRWRDTSVWSETQTISSMRFNAFDIRSLNRRSQTEMLLTPSHWKQISRNKSQTSKHKCSAKHFDTSVSVSLSSLSYPLGRPTALTLTKASIIAQQTSISSLNRGWVKKWVKCWLHWQVLDSEIIWTFKSTLEHARSCRSLERRS